MCGIVGYIGNKEAFPILINGLKRLEYRGYDSAGISIVNGDIRTYKVKGKVKDIEEFVKDKDVSGDIGMGHTRWATHGVPSTENAHPHTSMNNLFILIHNGIIENYSILREKLINRGYTFKSETDTEILANLIEYIYIRGNEFLDGKFTAEMAIRYALKKVSGAYALVVACKDEPNQLVAARKGSPLVVGVGTDEYFIASDATPIVEYTKSVIYLNDYDIAIIKKTELQLKTLKNEPISPKIEKLDIDIGEIEKGGYEHFMLKEIFEQPSTLVNTLRGRITADHSDIHHGGILEIIPKIVAAKRLIIIGCGTSWHAGLVGEYLFEEFARLPVEVEYASEFRYRKPVIYEDDIVIAISQSGETADTLAAIRLAKENKALVIGICNVVGSSISRETDAGIYTYAGPEIGVASTKAFTSQVTTLAFLSILIGKKRNTIDEATYKELILEISQIPKKVEKTLSYHGECKKIAELYKDAGNFLYLGRGYFFPVALEGALKLKEISYIHAEGYPAAEMKHGPIALIDENMPVVVIAAKDHSYEKIVNNIEEVKARKGKVIAIVTEGDVQIEKLADHILEIPNSDYALAPILAVIPLQLISYYIAAARGCNIDQPRNLAKAVTVE
ncbi:MAG: glutamine--fructose-6-phosphate transaminase (isomerizing) [Bacteroidetes bacterium]|jgi:glutamine---fructose-6-phosphate transaminase (isomerizing)|nr:glutamine--fructose-6-phosphate transaminase (isomerizing) [Bacteroidota bacterium]MBT6686814.1 glutamine--fructose-6-phosphate transaminase (isomerizing) [Bacteroidota bacterium]MBT7144144.1 glutamine--fructose-6-phosphate transaminase (isomerizing) [Bacteroidota bacterium]MBT7490080.1 glutamine--fructose-6-phosphate transaminase (isomerizing) [Bacteroidota bacterium]